jgi:hypothetical protein
MDVDGFTKRVQPKLASFSDEHLLLLQICFGNIKPKSKKIEMLNEPLTLDDQKKLYYMVQVEFFHALRKEMGWNSDVPCEREPKPLDVYLVQGSSKRLSSIAAVLPLKGCDSLAWYNGGSVLLGMKELMPKRRVSSLSGSARLLQALQAPISALTESAMKREMLQWASRNAPTGSDCPMLLRASKRITASGSGNSCISSIPTRVFLCTRTTRNGENVVCCFHGCCSIRPWMCPCHGTLKRGGG